MIHSCTVHEHQLRTVDSQVCFHRQLFADLVKPSWYITGPVDPLGSTNQNWLGAKLLPMAVSIHPWFVYIPVVCWGHSTTVWGLMVGRACLWGEQGVTIVKFSSDSSLLLHVHHHYLICGCLSKNLYCSYQNWIQFYCHSLQTLIIHPSPVYQVLNVN